MSEQGTFEVQVIDRTRRGTQEAIRNIERLIRTEQAADRATEQLDNELLRLNRRLRSLERQARSATRPVGRLSDQVRNAVGRFQLLTSAAAGLAGALVARQVIEYAHLTLSY